MGVISEMLWSSIRMLLNRQTNAGRKYYAVLGGFPNEIKTKIRYPILVLISIGNPPIVSTCKETFR